MGSVEAHIGIGVQNAGPRNPALEDGPEPVPSVITFHDPFQPLAHDAHRRMHLPAHLLFHRQKFALIRLAAVRHTTK
jgi:hypothetical protein